MKQQTIEGYAVVATDLTKLTVSYDLAAEFKP